MFDSDFRTAGNRWNVVRLSAGSTTELVLLSPRFFCLTTHFQRVTIPCAVDDCALCELLPSRGLFYVAGHCAGQVRLLELGAASASHFEQHAKLLHGGMRAGLVFRLSRRGAKAPVHSEVLRVQESAREIPLLSLAAHTMALYKFPPPNPGDSMEQYSVRCSAIARRRNELAAAQLLKGKKTGV